MRPLDRGRRRAEDEGARLYEHRHLVDRKGLLECRWSTQQGPRVQLRPEALRRHPEPHAREWPRRERAVGHGCHEHARTKHVLVGVRVGRLFMRPLVVERSNGRRPAVVSVSRGRVQVGKQLEALLQSASNGLQVARRVMPRPLFDRGGSESVDAHNGRKGAKLDPTHEELTLARLIEAPYVVRPVAKVDIGCGGGEGGLKRERLPKRCDVACEANWIALVAKTAVAMHDETPTSLRGGCRGGAGALVVAQDGALDALPAVRLSAVDIIEPPGGVGLWRSARCKETLSLSKDEHGDRYGDGQWHAERPFEEGPQSGHQWSVISGPSVVRQCEASRDGAR